MGEIEIYSSKKKSVLLLACSLLFVAGGIFIFLHADNMPRYNPIFLRIVGIAGILFFGFGIYVSIARLVKNQLILIIDSIGINVNPKKSLSERIEWKNIDGFSEIKINSAKIIVIEVHNPDYWIENEESAVRKKMMEFNVNYCGSPFNITAGATRLSHAELMKVLNENFHKYNA